MPDLDRAEQFLAAHARVLDRRRFERLFRGGPAQPVRDAVAAHRNDDGGFGHALEPDCRAPGSQPGVVEIALRVLDEAGIWDEALVAGACDWLERTAPEEGGAIFVEPSIDGWPHAPWWQPQPERRASLITTGQIAGTLHARRAEHPWLERATGLMWRLIGDLDSPGPYEMYGVVRFLDHVPDRDRAAAATTAIEPHLRPLVTVDPNVAEESHRPLAFAPRPDSLARRLFDDATIATDLDRLAAGQRDDGGWTFDWPAWSPAAEAEWRDWVTVEALVVLRAYERG